MLMSAPVPADRAMNARLSLALSPSSSSAHYLTGQLRKGSERSLQRRINRAEPQQWRDAHHQGSHRNRRKCCLLTQVEVGQRAIDFVRHLAEENALIHPEQIASAPDHASRG